MEYLYDYFTTEGRVKKINQDAVFIMEAETENGNILFAAISDGMGGLAKGEEASARMTRALAVWFEHLPEIIYSDAGLSEDAFRKSMLHTIQDTCKEIEEYAKSLGAECGTTLAGVLLYQNKWYVVNVGDSRVYFHDGEDLHQITKDQSYVQREIDAGRMTEKEAKTHKMRSILLQCIGASDVVIPDWFTGEFKENDEFLLCSDGFRHVLNNSEMSVITKPSKMETKDNIKDALEYCTNRSMREGERDNISSILIKIVG